MRTPNVNRIEDWIEIVSAGRCVPPLLSIFLLRNIKPALHRQIFIELSTKGKHTHHRGIGTSMEERPPPSCVQNIVINALLESLYDILDRDGMVSILRAAGLTELMDTQLNPREFSDYAVFKRIIDAMNELLQFSEEIAYAIGRKFAIYSDPSGTGIVAIIQHLKEWIRTDWDIQIIQEDFAPKRIVIQVTNCPFCKEYKLTMGRPICCDFLRGIFSMSWEKTSRQAVVCMESDHVFTLVMLEQGGEA